MAGLQIVAVPSPGIVGGRPRKEPIYDSEVWPTGANIANRILFADFGRFAVAPATVVLTKQFGRDTNLQGGQSGLPQAHHLFWYEWRMKIRALGANLGGAAGAPVFEEINRARELADVTFRFSQSDLISIQCDELPSGVGPLHIATTVNDTTVLSHPNGVPDRRGKVVTVTGRPVGIQALENFRVLLNVREVAGAFQPTADLHICAVLEGMLLRGVTG